MARVRETYLKDYGISREYAKRLREYCKSVRGEQQKWLFEATQNACPDIAAELFYSLTTGVGYMNMSKKQYIPIKRDDFQGYQRKALEEFERRLRWNRITI